MNNNNQSASQPTNNSIGKVVCVGRNYAAHAAELGNEIPERPILFIKPASCVQFIDAPLSATFYDEPRNKHYAVHYETELCIRLAQDLSRLKQQDIAKLPDIIDGVTLGLDLTLREMQSELKAKGHPWERAKCFDGACVLAEWIEPNKLIKGSSETIDWTVIPYQLLINDTLTQDADTSMMLFPIHELLAEISQAFSLQAGDVIMTGTPSGVGQLRSQDELTLVLGEHQWRTKVT